MTNVLMKAIDTLHVSSVKADNLQAGDKFEVSSATADDLEQRGLASRVEPGKQASEPENKAEPEPVNKAAKPAPKKKV